MVQLNEEHREVRYAETHHAPDPALRTPHLVALLATAHGPLVLLWIVVPAAFAFGHVVATPLIFALAGLILLSYVLGYSGLGRRLRHSGGLYVQVSVGLGRSAGLATALLFYVSYIGVAAGIYGLMAATIRSLLSNVFDVDVRASGGLLLGLAAVLIAARLPRNKLVWVCVIAGIEQLLAVLWFDLAALAKPAGGTVSFTALNPSWLLSGSFAVAIVFSVTSLLGSEVATSYSTELAQPTRTIPRATYLTYGLVTVLLVVSAWAIGVRVGPENAPEQAAVTGGGLVPVLIGRFVGGGATVVNLLMANLVIAIVLMAVAFVNSAGRQLAGLARDGLLPDTFAIRRRGDGPPLPAVLVQPVIAGVIALIATLTSSTGVLPQWLIIGAGLGVIGVFVLASAASAVWFLRGEADEGGYFGWEGQVIAGVTSVLITGWLFGYGVTHIRDVVPGAPEGADWVIGTAILGLYAAGLVAGRVLRATRPAVYARIGQNALTGRA